MRVLVATAFVGSLVVAGEAPLVRAEPGTASTAGPSRILPSGVASADAGLPAQDAGGSLEPSVRVLVQTAQRIHAFLAGRLAVSVDPPSLFDIALDDERGIRVEATRIAAIVRVADEAAKAEGTSSNRRSGRGLKPAPAVTSDGGGVRADAALSSARLKLDRARLEFYTLAPARRAELLADHLAAVESAAPELTPAERRAQEAEAERKRALEAAENARTEAERVVAEEYARLLDVSKEQAEFEASLERDRGALKDRSERTLNFERQVRELSSEPAPETAVADELYKNLRTWLRASRDELAGALSGASTARAVPDPGADALSELPVAVRHDDSDRVRRETIQAAARLSAGQTELRDQRIKQLGEEIRILNQDRLALLPLLSGETRTQVTGFGIAGLDQATSEIRQVTLILRYHLHSARRWIEWARAGRAGRSTPMAATLVLVEWTFAAGALVWWKRRAADLLTSWRARVRARDRRDRAVEPSISFRLLGFALAVHRPLEWLLFGWCLFSLLPAGAAGFLEVALARTIFIWTFGGALAVSTIDFLAGRSADAESDERRRIASLRLRSLRLVGRTIVVFALILSSSVQLVGRGTIYGWVWSTCWFAAVPVGLVVVRWWREEIFLRIHRTRKKGAFDHWIERNHDGWGSFFAAATGGAYLFVTGSARAGRNWVSRFDVTRRALAYLFRRGLDRLAEEKRTVDFRPLPVATFDALSPETPSADFMPLSAGEDTLAVLERIRSARGGVFALVGERGSGKTTLVRHLQEARPGVTLIECPFGGRGRFEKVFATAVGLPEGATLEETAARLDSGATETALIIDDAHRLIRRVMGGLAAFDRCVSVAREHSKSCRWVFAMDEVVWRFFERARGARPLFDEVLVLRPWREEAIANFIEMRCFQAGVQPTYAHVMQRLPLDADDEDRADAIGRTAGNYHRLLWDYSAGNPAVALHLWRKSLGVGHAGEVCVKPFQAPDTADLEQLPDPAVFVLRAVIQLERATLEDIVAATMLPPGSIEDTLRYGTAREYFEKLDGRYRVTWAWFRAVTRFLQRRHLLARPAE